MVTPPKKQTKSCAGPMADFDDEEARAERAREFRENLSKPKDVRKRYSIASPYAKQGALIE